MRKVLFVSFMFPPSNSIAAVRAGKLTKYLPEFGWEPVVLTASNVKKWPQTLPLEIPEQDVFSTPFFSLALGVAQGLGIDVSAQARHSPSKAKLILLNSLRRIEAMLQGFPGFHILFTDPIGWYPRGVSKGRELIESQQVDAIFSSYGPSTSHLIASRLQRATGLPWIAEFRDSWSHRANIRRRGWSLRLEGLIERIVMKNSSLLVAISEPMAAQLEALHRKVALVIHNGFDEADYVENASTTEKFTITYTGNIDKRGMQDPASLLEAIRELHLEGRLSAEGFELRFYGGKSLNPIFPAVRRMGLEGLVRVYGFIPFAECVRRQKESTALLLLKWNDPAQQGIYTGKVFEYLGAQRPIIAVGGFADPPLDDLMAKSGIGVTARGVAEIKAVLSTWLDEFRESGRITSHFRPDAEFIRRFTRRKQAEMLASALDRICGKG